MFEAEPAGTRHVGSIISSESQYDELHGNTSAILRSREVFKDILSVNDTGPVCLFIREKLFVKCFTRTAANVLGLSNHL